MAKKKKEFTFSEVGTIIENSIKTTSIVIEDVNSNTNREFIGTGIYLLNALCA